MLSIALIAFFVAAGAAALVSLADSALKLRHAWDATGFELERLRHAPAPINDGAVVMLRPATAGLAFHTNLSVAAVAA